MPLRYQRKSLDGACTSSVKRASAWSRLCSKLHVRSKIHWLWSALPYEQSTVTETMQSKKPFLLFLNPSSAEYLPIMSNHLRQGLQRRHSNPLELLAMRVVKIMLLELSAQIHCLQLLDGGQGCLSFRTKVRRNVLPGESHSLEVCLCQLVVEVLLWREGHKSAMCHTYPLGTPYPGEDSCRLGSVEG